MKLFAFGEILWDVYPDNRYIGGAPFNFAAHFVKRGGEAALISAVGDDSLGADTVCTARKFGVETRFISSLKNIPTGRCDVTLDENSVPTYNLLNNVAYDFIDTNTLKTESGVLYFGTLALRNEYNRKSLKNLISNSHFDEIFVDINIRAPFYSEEVVKFAARNATVIKISDEELWAVSEILKISADTERAALELRDIYPNLKVIIITLGGKGAIAYERATDKLYRQNAKKVEVVSTVGAGDSFAAAFLYDFLSGEEIQHCLETAAKVSAYVVSKKEAIPK